MTITEVATRYGLSLRTLRFYEERGLLKPERFGNSRLYHPTDRIRLELILKGRRLGFSLSEIEQLIARGQIAERSDVASALDRDTILGQIKRLTEKRDAVSKAIEDLEKALSARCA